MNHYLISASGCVQGVGFRPFIFRLAHELGLSGSVRNNGRGVIIHVAATADQAEQFTDDIRQKHPPLARIITLSVELTDTPVTQDAFTILPSESGEDPRMDVARDTAACADCTRELFDPKDQRYRHPFINCTNCGPRFSIIKDLPYDRPFTTMAGFPFCPDCKAEYEDPSNRRFHAQPVCCPNCGPQLQLLDSTGKSLAGDPINACTALLTAGKVVAIKGIGGFHCAARADKPEVVQRMRAMKRRPARPFACMARDVNIIRRYCEITPAEEALLTSPERPITLLRASNGTAPLAMADVAPGMNTLGFMLPYTPIQHLLFATDEYEVLIMTSANPPGEPLCRDNEEAFQRLDGMVDAYLIHDRPIHTRIDDSVVRTAADQTVFIRRARGYVPEPLTLDLDVDGIVALGGIQKSTVAIGRGHSTYVSQYLGTVDNTLVLDHIEEAYSRLSHLLNVTPTCFVSDSHPDNPAEHLIHGELPLYRVQHHHAHAASCMAENGLNNEVIAVVYDGAGAGDDDTIWGGEILKADYLSYERMASLKTMLMPGGDQATIHPGRMAIGALHDLPQDELSALLPWMDPDELDAVLCIIKSGGLCPKTTSMGRLFDAMSSILDICRTRSYEGEPAARLEAATDRKLQDAFETTLKEDEGRLILDGADLLTQGWKARKNGESIDVIGAKFHNGIIRMTINAVQQISEKTGILDICLCGGCFQNAILTEGMYRGLQHAGLTPHIHRALSPNDESISLGQLCIAAAKREHEVLNNNQTNE